MIRTSPLAAAALLSLLVLTNRADAQTAPPANPNGPAAIRAARIKAAQAAAAAAAKATPVVTTPPPLVTVPPVVTAPPQATVAPTATALATTVKPVASAPPATSGSAAPVAVAAHPDTAGIALDLDALKKTRPDRRHAEFLDLQARFGGLLSDARATTELKQHAQRVAYLQRIRALGVKANDANFVKSVDALITSEETRDANALNALRASALPVAVPAAATAVAVPVAPAAAGVTK